MTVTPTPIWALLGVSCMCLLLGNRNVRAEREQMQARQEVQGGKSQCSSEKQLSNISNLPPALQIRIMKEKPRYYPFPIVSKDGVLYYDLSGVNDTNLVIFKNCRSVKGITASPGECKVRFLHLGIPYILDEDLLINCPQLSFKLTGKNWRCLTEGRLLQQQGVVVDMSSAECTDAWSDNSTTKNKKDNFFRYGMEEGIQKFEEFGITNCSSERCACKWYFNVSSYSVNVDCEGVGLTDDMLPTLPNQVTDVRLEKNALHSMDRLIKHLLPHHQTLMVLRLDDNQLETLPHFPNGTFPHIVDLSLIRNKIEKIDIETFSDLIKRKDLIINLDGNTFPCDCQLYRFKVFLQHNYMRDWKAFKSLMNMRCRYKDDNKTELMYAVTEDICRAPMDLRRVNWWLVLNLTLGVLNFIVIYLMVDLICILTCTRGNERRPMMDRAVFALRCTLCYLRPKADETYYLED